mgnify:CR=1 FL=1
MNENIANTGNHTAGGYAISKRLNNINSFNKAQSEIDLNKQLAETTKKLNKATAEKKKFKDNFESLEIYFETFKIVSI